MPDTAGAPAPSRDATVTAGCALCGAATPPGRSRRWCSAACRQAAYRRRTQPAPALPKSTPPSPARSRRDGTVYTCPACDTRLLGEQRCPDCHLFAVRLGPGGTCPHCDEIVAVIDLQPPLA